MMRWKNTDNTWGGISILIHWLTALVVMGLFCLGLWMVDLTYYDDWYHKAPHLHQSVGVLLLFLTLGRLLWLKINRRPQPLSSYSRQDKLLSQLMHSLLYVLIFGLIISGYLISTADGRVIVVFTWFEIPATISGINGQADIAGTMHYGLAIGLITAVVLHALAALKHHFIDKDATLKRLFGYSPTSSQPKGTSHES